MAGSSDADVLGLTAQIVSAHLSNNSVAAETVPALIQSVYSALTHTNVPVPVAPAAASPAVPVRKSVFPDFIICLEDGRKLKMLKRHLQTSYNLTPEQYRAKWGLPSSYPMVASNYADRRSALAKRSGLGRKEETRETPGTAPVAVPSEEPPVVYGRARRARGSKG